MRTLASACDNIALFDDATCGRTMIVLTLWLIGESTMRNGHAGLCCISGTTPATERVGTTTTARPAGPSLWNLVRLTFSQKATSLTIITVGYVHNVSKT